MRLINLRYLLLFGDASYDYKDRINNNTSLVPAYENNFALDPLVDLMHQMIFLDF